MKAESRTLQRIFEQSIRYCVPLFQRPYVWEESENWEPLWEDIRRLADQRLSGNGQHRTHFIGAIVLEQLGAATGSIETRQIIDGQQRLTTLQILLTVLKDLCMDLGLMTFKERFGKFSRNDAAFIDTEEEAFKVWPTNPDRLSFRITLNAGTLDGLKARMEELRSERTLNNEQLPKAYEYFTRAIREWLGEVSENKSGEQAIDALWHVISGQLRLVTIDLDAEDDAQVIFETLNSRGADLLPADLVKNYLFRQAEGADKEVEQLYEKYWKPFDDDWWRKEMRQGRMNRPRLDLFLQHYLSLKMKDDVLVTHIFETYKQYATGSELGPEALIEDLFEYGKVFQHLVKPHPDARIALFLERLAIIDTATVYPFLLEAFRRYDHPTGMDELRSICCALESFLVRRMICRLTSKNYNRLFLELLSHCDTGNGVSAHSLEEFLGKSDAETSRWPSNEEFKNALLTMSVFTQISKSKLRLLLAALNQAMETTLTEEIKLPDGLTIEHLLPQKWEEHWAIDEPDDVKRKERAIERDFLKHRIGNLTLLTKRLNPAISNADWDTKQPAILRESKLNLNRAFQNVVIWNEESIRQRNNTLADLALKIWPVIH